ncbi:MAG: hypothetical protein WC955_05030 [Elusimicrobiota bacterium]
MTLSEAKKVLKLQEPLNIGKINQAYNSKMLEWRVRLSNAFSQSEIEAAQAQLTDLKNARDVLLNMMNSSPSASKTAPRPTSSPRPRYAAQPSYSTNPLFTFATMLYAWFQKIMVLMFRVGAVLRSLINIVIIICQSLRDLFLKLKQVPYLDDIIKVGLSVIICTFFLNMVFNAHKYVNNKTKVEKNIPVAQNVVVPPRHSFLMIDTYPKCSVYIDGVFNENEDEAPFIKGQKKSIECGKHVLRLVPTSYPYVETEMVFEPGDYYITINFEETNEINIQHVNTQ